jgi:hypothetical protein
MADFDEIARAFRSSRDAYLQERHQMPHRLLTLLHVFTNNGYPPHAVTLAPVFPTATRADRTYQPDEVLVRADGWWWFCLVFRPDDKALYQVQVRLGIAQRGGQVFMQVGDENEVDVSGGFGKFLVGVTDRVVARLREAPLNPDGAVLRIGFAQP